MKTFQTKVPYPQVIRRLLETLNCPLTVQGCRQASKILRSYEVNTKRIASGEFEGCWDDERINVEIANQVLSQYPQLQPVIDDFREEDCDYSSLCGWLNGFIEKTAWLEGNRAWPVENCIPVKSENGFGLLEIKGSEYLIFNRVGAHGTKGELWKKYNSAIEMAFDGWSID